MKKLLFYAIVAVLTAAVLAVAPVFAGSLNIISFLGVMVAPIAMYAVIIFVSYKSERVKGSYFLTAAVCAIIYCAALGLMTVLVSASNGYQAIYENSKGLFTEGFSVGSEIGFTASDLVLPTAICFVVCYVSALISKRKTVAH